MIDLTSNSRRPLITYVILGNVLYLLSLTCFIYMKELIVSNRTKEIIEDIINLPQSRKGVKEEAKKGGNKPTKLNTKE